MKLIKCKVCDNEFIPTLNRHYIAKDAGETGIKTMFANNEETIFDAFDCPVCGCQVIMQERKRVFVPYAETEEEEIEKVTEKATIKSNIEPSYQKPDEREVITSTLILDEKEN